MEFFVRTSKKNLEEVGSETIMKHVHANILKILQQKKKKKKKKKKENFQIKKSDILYIFIKHRLWVLLRTASVLTSTHIIYVYSKIRKIMYTPVNPSFTI